MRFVADEMLGKLARWMRFMGMDVVYRRPFPDEELIDVAAGDGRVLITRDRKLYEQAKRGAARGEAAFQSSIEAWLVEEDLPFDQLVDIVRRTGVDPFERAFTRCSVCNHELAERTREEVAGRVPPFVFSVVDTYRECAGCGKIYWAGSHRSRIEKILREAKKEALGVFT